MLMDYPLLKHPAGAAQETLRHWANDNRQAGSKHHYLECPHFVSKSDVGVWHHLAVTAQGSDPTDGWSAYKDGKELNCRGGSDQFDEPYHADLIGAHSVAHRSKQSGGADKSKYRYFGDFDDIRIWNTVRSQKDIRKTMGRGVRLDPSTPHLQHYYHFDDGTVNDQAVSSKDGTFSSTQWRVTVLSVQGKGKRVQLDEIGFADASGSQLGVGTVAPVVSPQYQKKDQERASLMNNGNPTAADQTDCSPLPCTFTYTYNASVAVASVVLAHADSPKLFPATLKVEYYSQEGSRWLNAGANLTVSDPPFVRMAQFKLSMDGIGGNNANSVGDVHIYCS